MNVLSSALRKQLEASVLAARRAAESASRSKVESLGVFSDRRPEHLDEGQASLRNGLRAKWRQLGGDRDLLIAECAYEQWHRLLFARFLAENSLLLHPQYHAPVTLADCEDLAAELGEPDGWSVAARFAAEILPGIFRLDDPCVQIRLAPEGRHALEQILDAIPAETFAAEDSLGWVYQFWQKDKKDEVNASERKIGGPDLGPVTQLFTENYMVRFLLENSLGAWWAARRPDSPLIEGFDYLRFDEDGHPASGSFEGWPERVAEVTVMDPCCGSGHFLVAAFSMLWQMRAEEEGLTPLDAQDAVLRDNLFGLELDPRCVQIAMFAVALQAWKAGGGWRQLPVPNIACSGIPVKAPVEEWTALAGGDERLENALVRLHILFQDADTLGSLIDPKRATEISDSTGPQKSIEDVEWEDLELFFRQATNNQDEKNGSGREESGLHIAGLARAGHYLSHKYTLVVTNPPFLSTSAVTEDVRKTLQKWYPSGWYELAACLTERSLQFANHGGTIALITPENWLFLNRYEQYRRSLLIKHTWEILVRLGMEAFHSPAAAGAAIAMWIASRPPPSTDHAFQGASIDGRLVRSNSSLLASNPLVRYGQCEQINNPSSIPMIERTIGKRIADQCEVAKGLGTGDRSRFIRQFWEVDASADRWEYLQGAREMSVMSGRSQVILWENEGGSLAAWAQSVSHLNHAAQAWRVGKPLWGSRGVAVNLLRNLRTAPYFGDRFEPTIAVLSPKEPADVDALWAFCQSDQFVERVRAINPKLSVETVTLQELGFDLDHWRKVAEEAGPLPEPWSDDPTQWLFEGRPEVSTAPLQVAVARLLGYRWPEQADSDDLDALTDTDGIVCLPAVASEASAADRLQQLLATAFGGTWAPTRVRELLEQAGSKKKNLADWLRDEFFKQHCALFGNRPLIWHIWDGQRDGFSALVNYHRLDRKALEKLTYTYLGQDWVERQRAAVHDEIAGAEGRLEAAVALRRKLEAILEGEAPFDIYVRWKDTHEQAIGWDPDLNDGVRLNVRPFVEAGVLRSRFNVKWGKDRGKNPDGSERHNDLHLTLAQKREPAGVAG